MLSYASRSKLVLRIQCRMFSVMSSVCSISSKKKEITNINEDPEYLKFYNESTAYLHRELKSTYAMYSKGEKDRKEVIQQFEPILNKWGWCLLKSPLAETANHIHIQKTGSVSIDILMDYKDTEDAFSKEMQLLVSSSKGLLYSLGQFSRGTGFTMDTCYLLDESAKMGILDGNFKTFSNLANKYGKPIVGQDGMAELSWLMNEKSDLIGVRERIDVLINDYIAKICGVAISQLEDKDSGEKLRHVLWLLAEYCELEERGRWYRNLTGFQ
ncbi:hypothetical protein DAMA08_019560 [Martiniozyma asiatica (nom. inval.)]|nr:hypothetical protein DAMA08_019560 [Martiniozyma asiatica]